MLEVRDIHTYYGDSYVLQGVSLKAERGTVVAVLGRNGMGKTTLMRSIIGFTPPRRGQLWFKGVDITRLGCRSACCTRVEPSRAASSRCWPRPEP